MRSKPIALTLIVLMAAGGAWWWKSSKSPHTGTEASTGAETGKGAGNAGGRNAAQSVSVLQVSQQDVPVTIEASGTVSALHSVDLRAQTTSTVREVLIKDGETVHKGQLLFRFDDRADRANLDKARAQLARDRAGMADLERQYKRSVDLRNQNFISQSALDTALASLDAQRALLQSDEAAVQSAAVSLSYNEIRAPLNGRAGLVNVVVGTLVQASSTATPLLNIAQINPIGVSIGMPETQLPALLRATRSAKPGQAKTLPLSAQITLQGSKEAMNLNGRVTFVDNLVDTTTGTIKVRAEFDNDQQQLWPGQYVRMRMTLSTLKGALVIPQAAIIQRSADRSVYVVGADKTAVLKQVQVVYPFGDMAVVEGLDARDVVVLDGKQNLRPGTPLHMQPAALDPAAAASQARAASGAAK